MPGRRLAGCALDGPGSASTRVRTFQSCSAPPRSRSPCSCTFSDPSPSTGQGPTLTLVGQGFECFIHVEPDRLVIVLDRRYHVNQLGLDKVAYFFEIRTLFRRIDKLDRLSNHAAGMEHETTLFTGFAFRGLLRGFVRLHAAAGKK